jgi:monovalent cation:H+ antiporter-2, CPA2 family
LPIIASHNFLEDLAFVLSVAAFISVIFQALRQPVVVGYLVAGMLVGPYLPFPLFADMGRIHTLSELGVIMLMFALGLEFSVRKLAQLAPTAGFITVVQVSGLMWLGYEVGRAFGWTDLEGVFAGAILAISSTTIIAKAFAEENVDKSLSELVFGVALFEDLAAVIILAVLTAVASGAGLSARMVGVTVGELIFFLTALISVGLLLMPRAIRLAARFERDETLIVASVGACFAIAMIAELAGYSVALGAFLAGVLVSESGHSHKIEHLVAPLRDIFGAIFFVSVGMTLDPRVLVAHWPELIAMVAVVFVGKIVGVGISAMLSGSPTRRAVQAGMAMAQIGEFSFIIAEMGLEHKAISSFLYALAIAVSVVTTFTTPFMIRASDRVGRFIDAQLPRSVGVLQTIYDSWAERMRARRHPHEYRGAIAFILLSMGAVVGVAIVYTLLADHLEDLVAATTGWSADTAEFIVGSGALALAAVPCAAIWLGAHRLSLRIAYGISRKSTSQTANTHPTGSYVLAGIFEIAIIFGAVTVLLAIIGPFMTVIDGLTVMIVAMASLTIVIWRSARHLYAMVREASIALVERMDTLDGNSPTPSAVADTSESLGGIGPLTQVAIPEGSAAIGRSLSDLNLHATTGAMVMAIARDGRSVILPGGTEVLGPGDTIVIAGPSGAVAAARHLLTTSAHSEPSQQPTVQ